MKQADIYNVSVVYAPFPMAELTQAERAEQKSGNIRTLSEDKCLLPIPLDGTADDARLKIAHQVVTMEQPQPFFDRRARLEAKDAALIPHHESRFQQELPKIGFAVTGLTFVAQMISMDAQADLKSLEILDFWPTALAAIGTAALIWRHFKLNNAYAETQREITAENGKAMRTKKHVLEKIEKLQQNNASPLALTV